MKFVRGKRMFRQELLWGFVLVTEVLAGVRTFGLILGRSVWGFQWKLPKPKSSSGSARISPRSSPNTDSK
jgi:hypothetical protein